MQELVEQRQISVYRDPDIMHRFWFRFPDVLRTASTKNRVIGVRSCTLRSTDKRLEFQLFIRKTSPKTGKTTELALYIQSNFKRDDTFAHLIKDIRFFVKGATEAYKEQWTADGTPVITQYDIGYSFAPVNDVLCLVIEGRDQRNPFIIDSLEAETFIRITDMNEATQSMLLTMSKETGETYQKKLYFPMVWDRGEVLLKSNLAVNSFKNYLGFSGSIFMPVKYFELSHNDTSFWVEMYSARDLNTPAVISLDGSDTFIFELAITCLQ